MMVAMGSAEDPPAPARARHAIVIGAGVAGLATAAVLGTVGYRVTVLERTGELGGRMGELEMGGYRFETGPSWYLMPEVFDRFFARFGKGGTPYRTRRLDPAYRVYLSSGERADVRSGHAREIFDALDPGSGERLDAYLRTASEVYRLAEDKFLYTTFSRPRDFFSPHLMRRLPLLARLLAEPLSTRAGRVTRHPVLRKILEYPAVFLSGRPEKIPSLYHLMSYADLVAGVTYPEGGFAEITCGLVEACQAQGVEIRNHCEVTEITTRPRRGRGRRRAQATGVRYRVLPGAAGQGIVAEHTAAADLVVSCGDLFHTENALLPTKLRSYPRGWWRRRDPGPGAVVVLLGVRGKVPGLLHHTLFFDRDWRGDFDAVFEHYPGAPGPAASDSIYVCRASATNSEVAPAGCENLFLLIPTAADPALGPGNAYGQEESPEVTAIADRAIRLISRRLGVPDLPERIEVRRTIGPADFARRYHAWRAGAIGPAHTLRQSAFLRGSNASKKVAGLFYAGATTLPGVGVPMCLISAENVLRRVHEQGL